MKKPNLIPNQPESYFLAFKLSFPFKKRLRNYSSEAAPSDFQKLDDTGDCGSTGKNSLADAPTGLFKDSLWTQEQVQLQGSVLACLPLVLV
jgi:hypothetical protein